MHQAANSEMSHQETVEFLPYQIGSLAAQHDVCPAQVCLQFVEGGLDLPALMIEGGQFAGRGLVWIENSGRNR